MDMSLPWESGSGPGTWKPHVLMYASKNVDSTSA